MNKILKTYRADNTFTGRDNTGATIEISLDMPQHEDKNFDMDAARAFMEEEAKKIESVLIENLPGGLYDFLLAVMLNRKASIFHPSLRSLFRTRDPLPNWQSVQINPPRTDSYLTIVERFNGQIQYNKEVTYSEVDGWEINGVIAWAEVEE